MVDIRPFSGLRYNPSVVGGLTQVICPPYDVISPAQQRELYQRTPFNAIRLELAEAFPDDTPDSNRYTRTAGHLQQWLAEGVLVPDAPSAMYLVEEQFTFQGRSKLRQGLTTCVRLEEFEKGIVIPHEYTTAGPKQDRLELMKACRANISPIMSLYRDTEKAIARLLAEVKRKEPVASTEPNGQVSYRVWAIQAPDLLQSIRGTLSAQPIYLADGHHRYETALNYRNLMLEDGNISSEASAANFVMMTMISMNDPDLLILPYHRLVGGLNQQELEGLNNRMRELFEWEEVSLPSSSAQDVASTMEKRLQGKDPRDMVYGIYMALPGQAKGFLLSLKGSRPGSEVPPLERCDMWFLHQQVLKPALGEDKEGTSVTFVHDEVEAIEAVQRGERQMAFLLRPLPLELFAEVVRQGDRLPPKATFFYPKLPTGLVINRLEGELGE